MSRLLVSNGPPQCRVRNPFIGLHLLSPGSLHSQKFQPLTFVWVMTLAASEGLVTLWPWIESAPLSTSPQYSTPLYAALNSVPFGNLTPLQIHAPSELWGVIWFESEAEGRRDLFSADKSRRMTSL